VSDLTAEAPVAGPTAPVLQRLSRLDRFLPVWILAAMVLGIGLGRVIPGLADALDTVKVGSVSLPIAVGLLLMMYPVLAKVRYRQLDRVTGDKQLPAHGAGASDPGGHRPPRPGVARRPGPNRVKI